MRCVTLVLVISVAGALSWYYNTKREETEQNGVRYTWLTWLEVLGLVTGLVQIILLGLFLNFVSKSVISTVKGINLAQAYQSL